MGISKLVVPGGRIAVEDRGEGPVVVCSPAMGDVRDAYEPLVEALVSQGFRVVTADLRGHGDSDASFETYGDEATAEDLIALIEHLGAGPVVLVGASMSAASAVIVAGRRPDLVRALVLVSPFLRGPVGLLARCAMRLALRLLLVRPWGPWVWQTYSAGLWPGLPDARGRAARLTALARRPGYWRAFRLTARTDHRVVEPWLDRVDCPALVVMGAQDPDWADPAAEASWAADAIGAKDRAVEVLMVPRAGHAPMLENPQPVSSAVIELAQKAATGTRRTRCHEQD